MLAEQIQQQPAREIAYRTRGHTRGPITRLVSPSDLGELIKPFLVAKGATRFVVGSARKHPHDLVLGSYSVHTSDEARRLGEAEIRRIGERLRADGTIRR